MRAMQKTAHHTSPTETARFAHPRRNVVALGIQTGMRVADFGAGSGAYTHAIAAALEGTGRVYAIDVQRDLLRKITNEATRLGYQNVDVIWADLEAPRSSKLADASIDLVLISNLLFQVPDKLLVLREAQRILKPGGRVIVIDWSDPALSGSRGAGIGPSKDDVVAKKIVLETAERAGLTLQREFAAGAHHYGLILVKQGA